MYALKKQKQINKQKQKTKQTNKHKKPPKNKHVTIVVAVVENALSNLRLQSYYVFKHSVGGK